MSVFISPFSRAFYSLIIVLITVAALYVYFLRLQAQPSQKVVHIDEHSTVVSPAISLIPIKNSFAKTPQVQAKNVALYDVDSGTLLYGVHENEPVPIASITKIMTAILSLELYKLSDAITISKEATHAQGSVIGLKVGEIISVESLLYGLLIPSGNDAAYALAENIVSTKSSDIYTENPIASFVSLMNQKATELGLTHTVYKDPAGLDDSGISSARDQGLLISYALKNEMFKKIVNTPETIIYSADTTISHHVDNSNRLVKNEMYYQGIIGGKTGFTPTAGHNLITAANRNGHTLVAVIINTFDSVNKAASAIEARKLLDWGFLNYTWLQL